MALSSRAARLVIAVGVALLIAYAVMWAQVSSFNVGRSDFTSFYVGGTLLREGHAQDLYSEALQAPLHARLIAPDSEANLPFVDAPVAAAIVLPVTFLGLDAAYRVWSVIELALLVLAVAIAVRAAPWPPTATPTLRLAAAAAALAGAGTLAAWAQAQWAPLVALGVAIAYSRWRRGHLAGGAAALVATAAVAKPQLALGLLAFMLGWRNRRVLLGGLAGAAAVGLSSLALVGPAGMAGFAGIVTGSTGRWDLHLMLSIEGLAGSYLGSGGVALGAAAAGSLAACGVALWLGSLVRRDPATMDVALAGAAVLSLLAAPHAYLDDLVMLAPVAAWTMGVAAARRTAVPAPVWRSPAAAAAALWALINLTALADLADGGRLPPGQLTAFALIAAATCACVAARRAERRPWRPASHASLSTAAPA